MASHPRAARRMITAALFIAMTLVLRPVAAQSVDDVRRWRAAHERDILRELITLTALPNVAASRSDIQRNVPVLEAMFERRRFTVQTLDTPGSPVLVARRDAPQPRGVLTFYLHYDGQPVDAREWTHGGPFAPVLQLAGRPVALDGGGPIDPETRLYARSASDDKGPIVALLAAVDALDAGGRPIPWSLRVVLDGEEEAGSPNFTRAMTAHDGDVRGDIAIMIDGPRHPSGRPTVYFGVRGGAGMTITVYGARTDLHSGNYGNWAPDPAMALSKLLASMKDDNGRVRIEGFYDDVTPLTADERAALDAIPNVEATLKQQFMVARPEQPDLRLEYKLNIPTLTITALSAGTATGQGRTVINGSATARLDIRLVSGIDPERMHERVAAHIARQGFYVIDREPTDAERLAHPLIARVTGRGGRRAPRTRFDDPIASAVVKAVSAAASEPVVRLPTLGGSLPYATFSETLHMPTIGISMANFDNNQHGADENLRVENLWEAIDTFASVMQMTRPQ